MVEDQPSDETGLSMGDTDQSKIESLASDEAVLSKGDADQSMVEHQPDDGDATDQPRVEHLDLEEQSPTDQRQPRDHESAAQSYTQECCEGAKLMLTLMTMTIVIPVLGCYRDIASKLLAEDGPEQHAEADTGKSNWYTSAAAVSATTQLAASGITKPGQPVKGQQLQAPQIILQVNEISIGTAETENNLPMEADLPLTP